MARLIIVGVLLFVAGCCGEPKFVHRFYVTDGPAIIDGETIPGEFKVKCQEEVWEYGKKHYIRDCD